MKRRIRGHRRRSHIDREVDLNIIAFMNLMVVLVPFLLTTAVFSRLSVLMIDLPTPGAEAPQVMPPPPLPGQEPYSLSIRLDDAAVVIVEGKTELAPIARTEEGGYDVAGIRAALAAIKGEHPEHEAIDILSRPDTPYGDLIAVMDATAADGGSLFADVRLGGARP